MTLFAEFSGVPDFSRSDFPAGLPIARISLENLRHNWRYLAARAKQLSPMAVIKADAYGHGLEPVARALVNDGCRTLAVGGVETGVLLRRALAASGITDVAILPLLGVLGPENAASAIEHNLIPMVLSAEGASWVSKAWSGAEPLPVAVKVETGMSRLGVRAEETRELVAALRSFSNLRPALLLSHFAVADEPARDEFSALQVERFLDAYAALREFWPDIAASLGNSAGYLAQDTLLAALPSHIGRPGYALYGGNPFAGTDRANLGAGLLPVMEVAAPVMGVHSLRGGQAVSYGCTFTAERDMRIAVVGAGYADGFSRSLSGRGHVCIRGRRCAVIGRVCMQMHVVDISRVPDVMAGDAAYLLGGEGPEAVSMADIARDWGTIPYEVFCLLGRNTRVYV